MADSYRILVVEDDPDPVAYLRLVLLRTHGEQPVRCPPGVRALLRGVTRTVHSEPGDRGVAPSAALGSARPITLILDQAADRLEVLTAYFGDAGCAVMAATGVEQALTWCSVTRPDLMVLPHAPSGMLGAGLDRLRSWHPTCPIAVTTVLDPGPGRSPAAQVTEALLAGPAR